ncbi:relaxase/mobilization nuclease domain-containing protein [Leucobacter weissii]|uniref:Relaxase/mobilization nuclease domain-containing protein n=1 Tax=Leucobacter weissii TaxID=1983706 RepID=A0A939MRE5_9MICO|nr:relaxase/mobilization nuclease domain-containing protein [Leucobacter weissii]MBO1903216.1 relaxase/mobilization nuclease domain-containing protein [Leucobacter weissii]
MAVVKMGQIKSTPAKALAYISRPDATADGVWVSTNADTIIDPSDFRAVARQFGQTAERVGVSKPREGAVLAHHVIQSFDPKDGIDVATAHKIGVQLAEQITGGSHEYMIATHLDKGHLHNHIILNAVNRETGRKFRVQKSTIGNIRELSDELCRAHGLSVLPKPERATGRTMADVYRVLKGESGKQFIRTEIDKAAMQATSWAEFQAILGRAGVEVSARGGRAGTLSFREISMPRAVRDYRLGAAYTEASIMARLTRQVVNQIGVDVSMVTRETRDTMTVIVPGTKRELHLTVAKTQVVRHGRALRIYVPANDEHRLSDARGNLAKTVPTMGLYKWFSEPDLVGAVHHAKSAQFGGNVGQWQTSLSELRALEARVNAKARWMGDGGRVGPDAAIERARAFVAERHFAYQTMLVATTELMVSPTGDPAQLAGLQAQLRIIEREIDGAKSDIHALTQLTKEETVMAVSDRIHAQSNAARESTERTQQQRQREQAAQRLSRDVAAGDAESNGIREARAHERTADAVTLDDAEQDRDGGTRSMTLQDRLEMEANKLRARNEDRARPEGTTRNDGRTR